MRESSVDFPTLGTPTSPTSAMRRSSSATQRSSRGWPGSACRGARCVGVAKCALPRPPLPPRATTTGRPVSVRSAITCFVSASRSTVPTGTVTTTSSPSRPCRSLPSPFPSARPAVGTALGDELLPAEGDDAVAPVSGFDVDARLIDKHETPLNDEARVLGTRARTAIRPIQLVDRVHAHLPPVAAAALVRHDAVDQGEEREVPADADVPARHHPRPPLPDDHRPGGDTLPGKDLDAQPLALTVPSVAGRSATLLLCHLPPSPSPPPFCAPPPPPPPPLPCPPAGADAPRARRSRRYPSRLRRPARRPRSFR